MFIKTLNTLISLVYLMRFSLSSILINYNVKSPQPYIYKISITLYILDKVIYCEPIDFAAIKLSFLVLELSTIEPTNHARKLL